jgi:hypothetical protein
MESAARGGVVHGRAVAAQEHRPRAGPTCGIGYGVELGPISMARQEAIFGMVRLHWAVLFSVPGRAAQMTIYMYCNGPTSSS